MLNFYKPCIMIYVICIGLGNGQYPRLCVETEALTSRECCPLGIDGSKCSEAAGRGSCESVKSQSTDIFENEKATYLLDERAGWPIAFYDRVCVCTNNYDGVDCSKCKYGYEGSDCSRKSLLKVRKNVMSLTVSEIQNFVDIVDRSKRMISDNYVILTTSYNRILEGETPVFKDISIYNLFIWIHYYVTRKNFVFNVEDLNRIKELDGINLQDRNLVVELLLNSTNLSIDGDVDYAHDSSSFLPWHRYFLMKLEAELREVVANDPDFTLPYWDWRDQDSCNICNDVMFGGRDPDDVTLLSGGSVFSKWQTICTLNKNDGYEYIKKGKQCEGESEGSISRNSGNYDSTKITGLPTSQQCNSVLQFTTTYDTPDYDKYSNRSFRNMLEGYADPLTGYRESNMSFMHNAVHLFFNGTMTSVETSANDPIFFVHHAFIDGLYEMWLQRRQQLGLGEIILSSSGPKLGHRPQNYMVPFFPLVRNDQGFADSTSFGYTYDFISNKETTTSIPEFSSTEPPSSDPSWNSIIIAILVLTCLVFVFVFCLVIDCVYRNWRNIRE